MTYRRYDHLERLGHPDVEGLLHGLVHVFPKLDGTNAVVWMEDGDLRAGSRNRTLSSTSDNHGFAHWLRETPGYAQIALVAFLQQCPDVTVYGEWLVPHVIKTYREDAWRRFWVFDVYDRVNHRYLAYEDYAPKLAGCDLVPPLCTIQSPTHDQLRALADQDTFLMTDGVGEGIVVKNYAWRNAYGRQPWAKVVRAPAAQAQRATTTTTIEQVIVDKYVDDHLVAKTRAKVVTAIDDRHLIIPQLLGRVYHDLVTECIWEIVCKHKNPTIDFHRLKACAVARVRELAPDLFRS